MILANGQVQLTKSMGQNFLHDANQLQRIVTAADLVETDRVLEIGPGLGPLTELLVTRVPEVLAIEKDHRLFEWLRKRYENVSGLKLVHGDALDYLRDGSFDWSGWKMVANLPYSVASPILVELAQGPAPPKRLVATLQFEVAQRIMSSAGHHDYGVLSLLVQLRYEPLGSFKIPASCFFPAPDVDSACVTLVRRTRPLLEWKQSQVFDKAVKRSFSQRRKMMIKLLKQDWDAAILNETFAEIGLSPRIRAEEVTLDQFVQLTRRLHPLDKDSL